MYPQMVNVFTIGESRDVNTWSNLPFYLCAALERQVNVRRINLLPDRSRARDILRWMSRLWALSTASHVDTFRTLLDYRLIERRIAQVSPSFAPTDLNLFLTFSFSSYRTSQTPVVHYCDRTYEHYLEEHGKQPTPSDRYFIEQEKENLRNASFVFATNQLCRDFIRERYGIARVVLLWAGINDQSTSFSDPAVLIREKLHSKEVVFIARDAYRR